MIKYISEKKEPIKETIKVSIIPELSPCDKISLSPGDTLVAFIDKEKWDINDAQHFYNLLKKTFPNNNICIMFDGVKLGVIKNDK